MVKNSHPPFALRSCWSDWCYQIHLQDGQWQRLMPGFVYIVKMISNHDVDTYYVEI